jgi:DHA2 family multidrug resistance protein
VQIYPANQRGTAMALFSVGILLGPILGPTVGGVITENMDWRWIFYVNVPVGLICLTLLYRYVKLEGKRPTKLDWPLVIGMVIAIGLLQMVLDRGNQEGWFASNMILFSTIISAIACVYFIRRSIITKGDVAPMWLLKDRNLAISCLMMAGFVLGMFGITQLQPMMLEQLLHYPVETTGFVMAPRGIASAVVLILLAKSMDKLDPRMLVAVGLLFNIFGTYLMMQYSMNIDLYWIVLPSIIQGMGMGLVFAPLSQMAYRTLSSKDTMGGAVLFNLFRTIGGSFGISIVNTYFSRTEQREWHALGADITLSNPVLQQQALLQNTSITDPNLMAQIGQLLHQQSTLLAFIYSFGFIMITYIALLPLLALYRFKKAKA